ncbi:MAG: cell wall-binding repeat-containing protein [Anaerosomatales bacterium]|nr:cell wall-binding repeat-containing protein [Anaerosomatales bacterium]
MAGSSRLHRAASVVLVCFMLALSVPAPTAAAPPAVITGTVVAPDGSTPVPGVRVMAYTAPSLGPMSYVAEGLSDVNGDYTISLGAGGAFILRVDPPLASPYAPEYWPDKAFDDEAAEVSLGIAESAICDVTLDVAILISGHVYENADGASGDTPVQNADVTLLGYRNPGWYDTYFDVYTDDTGTFSFKAMPGDYRIRARYPTDAYRDVYGWNKPSLTLADDITASETGNLVFSQGTISGIVRSESGDPIQNVEVSLYTPVPPGGEEGDIIGWVLTGADGRYDLPAATFPGTSTGYIVGFMDGLERYVPEFYDDVSTPAEATTLLLDAGETLASVDATLTQLAHLSGTIFAAAGPLGSGLVEAFRLEGSEWVPDRTWSAGADGVWRLGLPPGTYILRFSDENGVLGAEWWNDTYTRASATPLTLSPGQVVDDLDATLAPRGTVSGTVRDAISGLPIEGIEVSAYLPGAVDEPDLVDLTFTAADGTYSLTLETGEYVIGYMGGDTGYGFSFYDDVRFYDDSTTVAVAPATDTGGIDAAMLKVGSMSGTVTNADGVPLADIQVQLWFDDGGTWRLSNAMATLADGSYLFDFVASAETYRMKFTDPSGVYISEWYDDVHTSVADAQDIPVAPDATITGLDAALAKKTPLFMPIAGSTRILTSIEISKAAFPATAPAVVIATAYNWPDALGASALAGALGGPILLTPPDSLPAEVLTEVGRLGARTAYVVGGSSAVSDAVLSALRAKLGTANVHRVAGADRYATAREIARRTRQISGAPLASAFFATGENFPDALTASPIAARHTMPVLLVNPRSGLDSALRACMTDVGVTSGHILGGKTVVSAAFETALRTRLGTADVTRHAGVNRYATAVAIAEWATAARALDVHWNGLAIASGENFPDALSGSVLQGLQGSVVLITDPRRLSGDTERALIAHRWQIDDYAFLGGTTAVSAAVRARVADVLR